MKVARQNEGMMSWSSQCVFIFQRYSTESVQTFLLGCMITFFLCLCLRGLPRFSSRLKNALFPTKLDANKMIFTQQLTTEQLILKHGILPTINAFMHSVLYLAILLILMQRNGFVLIVITLGYTIGFFIFSDFKPQEDTIQCY